MTQKRGQHQHSHHRHKPGAADRTKPTHHEKNRLYEEQAIEAELQRLLNSSSSSSSSMAFKIKPGQLSELVDPKDAGKLAKLGGVDGVVKALQTSKFRGLDAVEAKDGFAARRQVYGKNVLPEAESTTFFGLVWEGLQDKTLIMLMVSAVVSLVLGVQENPSSGWIEGTAILIAVFTVVMVSAGNDYSKERQFRALNAKKENKDVKVVRDGQQLQVSVYDLNVGDVVTVETGDILPADGIYVDGHGIKCDESGVTGEADAIAKPDDDPYLLSGTQVLEGYGHMVVIAVGPNSINGKTMMSLRVESEDTPLQGKLDKLADHIGHIGLSVAILTLVCLVAKHLVIDWYANKPLLSVEFFSAIVKYTITAITMVVVAVPEGLPLAVTMALAYSMMKMLDDNNLVRHLAACETMGGATAICSDKTGTLTQNRMTVVEGILLENKFERDVTVLKTLLSAQQQALLEKSVALNSTAYEGTTNKGTIEFIGNKTESALLGMTKSLGCDYAQTRQSSNVVELLPFSSQHKSMAAVELASDGKSHRIYVKGASEIILSYATKYMKKDGSVVALDKTIQSKLEAQINSMAKNALRTIGLAFRDVATKPKESWEELSIKDLTLIGIVGIEDPLRDEVPGAVLTCQKAGIVVRMVTGDNKITAMNIAKNCGIYKEGTGQRVMEGPEFRALSEKEMNAIVPHLAVLARSSPLDKQILVECLKKQGEIVAVTGDGTNDGPALKLAHVGFSMGITGTEVAKEASDIILMDDNFSSIVKAVMWGRNVYDSIRKFLQFQLTVNLVAVTLAFIGSVTDAGGESPLKPVQLLWVNLIMDTMAALALATEPPSRALLNRKPYGQDGANLISPTMWKHVIGQAIFQLAVNFGLLYLAPHFLDVEAHSTRHLTIFFNTFVLCQVFNEINARRINDELNVFANFFNNYIFLGVLVFTLVLQFVLVQFGGSFAGTVALSAADWSICVGIAAITLPVGFLLRLVKIENVIALAPAPKPILPQRKSFADIVKKGINNGTLLQMSVPEHKQAHDRLSKTIKDVATQRSIIEFLRRNRRVQRASSSASVLSETDKQS